MKNTFVIMVLGFFILGCTEEQRTRRLSLEGSTAESVFLTHDQNENPVVVWTEKYGGELALLFAVSHDGGKSFSDKLRLPLALGVSTHAEGMPKVAFKKDGTIIAAYEKKAPAKENKFAGAICYVMSKDGGKSWTKEAFLHSDTISGRSRSYFDIELLPDGQVGASWLDIKLNNETGGRSVRFARTSGAEGFGNEILVDSSACQCCRIDITTDNTGNIFVAYRGLAKGKMGKEIRDMMISTSTDNGASFSSPLLISADNWNIDGCPHTGPSLCANKAGLFSLWYTEGTGTGVYYARKSKNDSEFDQRELVSSEGRHPQLCASGDQIAMLWEENAEINGAAHTVIHYRIVKDGNDLEKNVLTDASTNAFLPVVTKTRNGFLVAYLMETKGGVAVFSRLL